MAQGGFCKLPNGTVVVALTLPAPAAAVAASSLVAVPDGTAKTAAARGAAGSAGPGSGGPGTVRVLVHAVNRARALTRLRNLGLRAVYLRGNSHPPTPDEITAVLHHPDGLIWRTAPLRPDELWHPIRSLFAGRQGTARPEPGVPGATGVAGAAPGSTAEHLKAKVAARFVPKPLTVPEAWTASGA
jgi:hypothetical protein